jgi:RHS repeat-associated protein
MTVRVALSFTSSRNAVALTCQVVVSCDWSSTPVQVLDYYPYGSTGVTQQFGTFNEQKQYIAQVTDPETNLSYLNARYYDSARGQFTTEDPLFWGTNQNLKDPQSLNAYSYAENNPVTSKDPLGLVATVAQQVAVLQAQVKILQYFRNKVKNGGDWDLKQKPQYSPAAYPNWFVYDGKQIRSDAPGNIHYGYVGAAAFWSSPEFLLDKAGQAQVAAGTSQQQWQNSYFHGDDPVDQANILWGINMYYNQ